MRIALADAPPDIGAPPAAATCLPLSQWNAAAVGGLMWSAYRGTIDDDYVDEAHAIAEAEATLAGKWGPPIWDASPTAASDGSLVAAVICVHDNAHDDVPLLAFALTTPAWQGRGLGTWLIQRSLSQLAALGESEAHLAVTSGNPAQRLYERIGFREVA
jgi:GNAT superfamily N-acetyltransferase